MSHVEIGRRTIVHPIIQCLLVPETPGRCTADAHRRMSAIVLTPQPPLPVRSVHTRNSVLLAGSIVGLLACSLKPRLAPQAMGCYDVKLDSFPAVFGSMLVPRPPARIQFDTAFSGVMYVPVTWLEAAGYRIRSAGLQQMRPGAGIRGERLITERRFGALPPDSLVLTFSGPGAALTALIRADPSGDWFGLAYVQSSATPEGLPFVPIQLRRQTCDSTRMAVSAL